MNRYGKVKPHNTICGRADAQYLTFLPSDLAIMGRRTKVGPSPRLYFKFLGAAILWLPKEVSKVWVTKLGRGRKAWCKMRGYWAFTVLKLPPHQPGPSSSRLDLQMWNGEELLSVQKSDLVVEVCHLLLYVNLRV